MAIRDMAELELRALLDGTQVQRDLLGLLTAAGGGLTLSDLTELTELAPFEIKPILTGVTGRTFTSRPDEWATPDEGTRVYVLAHDTLREEAVAEFGDRQLYGYRDRLHIWADRYRAENWPPATPAYLLRGYFWMLNAAGDAGRQLACALDTVRHDRMRAMSGSDAAAQRELAAAKAVLLAQPDPDLSVMARLVMHGDDLSHPGKDVPRDLPAVWAVLGLADRAESLANSIHSPRQRTLALIKLAAACGVAGFRERAALVAMQAETAARIAATGMRGKDELAEYLANIAIALADGGLYDRAEAVTHSIGSLGTSLHGADEAKALTRTARALSRAGLPDRAARVAAEAEIAARSIHNDKLRMDWLSEAAAALADAGLLDRAEAIARSITIEDFQAWALMRVATALADAGQYDRAESLTASIPDRNRQVAVLAHLGKALAGIGLFDRAAQAAGQAETAAESIADARDRAWALDQVVEAFGAAGQPDHARRAADQAESAASSITEPYGRVTELVNLAVALDAAGLDDRADRLVDQAVAAVFSDTNAGQQAGMLIRVAAKLAATGPAQTAWLAVRDADAMADYLLGEFPPTPSEEAHALVTLAARAPTAGLRSRARAVALRAEEAARAVSDHGERARRLASAATVLAAAGLPDRAAQAAAEAEAAAYTVTAQDKRTELLARLAKKRLPAKKDDITPITEARVLTDLAEALAAAGLQDRARQIVLQAMTVALTITDMAAPGASLTELVDELAAAGLLEQARQAAEELADIQQFTRASDQAWVLSRMAKVFTAAGLNDQARQVAGLVDAIARKITGTQPRAWAMLRATQALAAAGLHERSAQAADKVETAARQITGSDERADLAAELARAGSFTQAESVTRAISAPPWKVKALIQLAKALATAGLHERARQMAGEAETLAASFAAQGNDQLLAEVTEALAAAGLHDRAESAARAITGQVRKAQALIEVAKALATAGLNDKAVTLADEAETIARSVPRPEIRAELSTMPAWTQQLAHHQLRDADWSTGSPIWEEMQNTYGSLQASVLQPELLTGIAEILTSAGAYDRAAANIAAITDPGKRALALISVAKILAVNSEQIRSRQLLAQALALGHWTEFLPLNVLPQAALIDMSTPLLRQDG